MIFLYVHFFMLYLFWNLTRILTENDSYCQNSKFFLFVKCLKMSRFFEQMPSKFAKSANMT